MLGVGGRLRYPKKSQWSHDPRLTRFQNPLLHPAQPASQHLLVDNAPAAYQHKAALCLVRHSHGEVYRVHGLVRIGDLYPLTL